MRSTRVTFHAMGAIVLSTLVLTACESAPESATSEAASATQSPSPVPEASDRPSSCGAVVLQEEAVIAGDDLADCVVDYLAFAGSGASEMTSETASSSMVWRMGERYEAYAELDTGARIVTTGESAWVDFGDTGWLEADPNTPGMEVAFGVVEAWRQTSGPEVTRSIVASSSWVVGERAQVDLPDGSVEELFAVRASSPFAWRGITIDAMTLWMREPGRVILQETTASGAGSTATSFAYHTRWGEEVEIPSPAAP